ncbi:MAG: hypothetical protein R3B13_05175 [Polyangiaceae bacterium]
MGWKRWAWLGVVFPVCLPFACGAEDSGKAPPNTGGSAGTGGSADASQSGGAGGGTGGVSLDAGDAEAAACVADVVEATSAKLPVDVILVVDTSATMAPVSDAVEANVNANLAAELTTSGIDYRLIVLAGYGSGAELCIGPPLGGANCATPPAQPANTSTFFQYPDTTGSGGMLANIVQWYNTADPMGTAPSGWSQWLRSDAWRVFVVMTDSESTSSLSGAQFDSQLLALTPANFGTASARRYTFHSIIGLGENTPATSPWLPSDPIVTTTCGNGEGFTTGAGEPFQEVSKLTGGLRFPVCQYQSFNSVFQGLAKDVATFTPFACDMPFPTPPAGKTIDPNTIQLTYTPLGGTSELFKQVKSAAECSPGSMWVEGQTIHVCPEACTKVNATAGGTIGVQFGCDVGFVK